MGKGSIRRPDTLARELAAPITVRALPAYCDRDSRLWPHRPCGGPVFKLAQRVPDPTLRAVGLCQYCGQRFAVPL